ncbi:MAG: SOS response-associated peptidase [Ideonella sp.]|jgi:putative SOS response-associated peptidase YedK|nr:SOS response-associated peptidase [Ideonella sp.]
MCANYHPVTAQDRLLTFFGVERPKDVVPPETWPGYFAPFVVRARDRVELERQAELGLFGLLPAWAKEIAFGRRTYNARSETVHEKPSFRDAWRRGQRCIVPAEAIYEPNWETGKAVRWRIARADGRPMGLAGLWSVWKAPDGRPVLSFTMLTINADDHPLMRRFHKPADEKRMVVVLDEADYDAWLDSPVERQRDFLRQYPSEGLVAEPAPLRR